MGHGALKQFWILDFRLESTIANFKSKIPCLPCPPCPPCLTCPPCPPCPPCLPSLVSLPYFFSVGLGSNNKSDRAVLK